jgi:hypothetical protein
MNPEYAISPNRIRIVMCAHGVGLGYVAVGLQPLPVLAGLLVLQLDAAAHQVDEDVEVVVLKRKLNDTVGSKIVSLKGERLLRITNYFERKFNLGKIF